MSRNFVPLSLALGTIAAALLGVGFARAVPDPPDVLPLSDVKPGMKGYGLTVFSGTTPEKFDVEIISTLHNFRPSQDLILIKTPNHPRLDAAHLVAGMSGSPIYLNGKMIGAYAYGWLFGSEPVAGVTPIKSMLGELTRPIPKALMPGSSGPFPSGAVPIAKPPRPQHAFQGSMDGYDLAAHAKQVAAVSSRAFVLPEGVTMASASTPILLGGMSTAGMKIAHDLLSPLGLDPLQAGGGSEKAAADAPTKFVDGGAIGVELVRGDYSAMGLGTVTRVSGDKLLAFGHPMLGGGVESLPTAIAKIHWILASTNRSFKIGEAVRSMGALVNDRPAAIVVDSATKAPTFPVKLDISGVEGVKKTWNMEVCADQFMAPSFTAMAIGSAAETVVSERKDFSWHLDSKIKIAKYGTIQVADFGAGNGSPLGVDDVIRGRLVRAIGGLLNNVWEDVKIEGVESQLHVAYAQNVVRLRGAKVLEPVIDPGQPLRIRLELEPHLGKTESKVIEIAIPKELAGHDIEVELAPGYEIERASPTPDSVAELVALLPNQYFDAESVVATFRLRENAAAFRGKFASRLPPSAMDTLRPTSASDAPETFAAQVQTAVPLQRFMIGRDTVHVEVRQPVR